MAFAESVKINAELEEKDSFGRERASLPFNVFHVKFDKSPMADLWQGTSVGGGSIAHNVATSSLNLSVGTTSGDKACWTGKFFCPYIPGKSQLIRNTFVPATPKANLNQETGYYYDLDGLFFRMKGLVPSFVKRSSTSGSPVETEILQSAWNYDKLDGTGTSGVTLDFTKAQHLVIDLQWQAVGRVRFGFEVNGSIHFAHLFDSANALTDAYMQTASLPVRYCLENTGITASASTMKTICATVISEGGANALSDAGVPHSYSLEEKANAVAAGTVGTPILAIRPSLLFNGRQNTISAFLRGANVFSSSKPIYVEIKRDATITGGQWVAGEPDSSVEVNRFVAESGGTGAAGAATGGHVIAEGYIAQKDVFPLDQLSLDRLGMSLNPDGTQGTSNIIVVAKQYAGGGGGATNASATLEVVEHM